MSGRHPLIGPGDFALVENTDGGAIVAATCLIRQDLGVRWNRVSSRPARDCGDHARFPQPRPDPRDLRADSRAQRCGGQLAQGITGIQYYYRQFGYEYALDLGGRRSVYLAAIPKLKPGDPEPYALREATPDDLPQLMALYDRERARGPISAQIDADYWRWVLEGQNPNAGEGWRTWLIVGATH